MFVFSKKYCYFLLLCVAGASAVMLVGCGNKDPQAAQIIAKVDGEEINLRQVNALLAKVENVTPENIGSAKLEILNNLVDQQLAVNLALSKKLDRKSEIVNAIDASRREILARAALDQLVAEAPPVGEEEAKRYYANNPALFADRRVFTLQEFTLKSSAIGADKLRTQLASTKRMEEMAAWLKDKKVEFTSNMSTRPAEQLATAWLSKLKTFKEGQMGLFEGQNNYTIAQLVSARPQPIAQSKAMDAITLQLTNQHAAEALDLAKVDMRTKAKLEYLGEFAGAGAAFKAGVKVEIGKADDGDAHTEARAKAEAKIVEQGIKGL